MLCLEEGKGCVSPKPSSLRIWLLQRQIWIKNPPESLCTLTSCPEKNPMSQKMKLIQVVFGPLLLLRYREMRPRLPVG